MTEGCKGWAGLCSRAATQAHQGAPLPREPVPGGCRPPKSRASA